MNSRHRAVISSTMNGKGPAHGVWGKIESVSMRGVLHVMLRQRKEFLNDDDETSLRFSGGTRREHGGIDHGVRNGHDKPAHGRFRGREFEQFEQFEQHKQFEQFE